MKLFALIASVLLTGCVVQHGSQTALGTSYPRIAFEAEPPAVPIRRDISCVAGGVRSLGTDRATFDQLRRAIPGWLIDDDVPSVALTYISEGAIRWTLVCGEQEPNVPASLSTLYNTASIAKPVVGEVVLRLASEGRLSLDEPMSAHWIDPDIAGDPYLDKLTPRIALAHETGFKNWRRQSEGVLAFQWEPGTQRGYSGEGIRYVARFLERKFETPFQALAEEVLFEPAGVDNASFVRETWLTNRVAWRRARDGAWAEPVLYDEAQGAGDLWITSQDYARIMLAVLNDSGVSEDLRIERRTISRDEVPRLCGHERVPIDVCPERMGFGVGWYVYEYEDHTLFAHSGSNNGEKTLALFTADGRLGFAVFANGENGNAVISKIARALYDNERFMELEGH